MRILLVYYSRSGVTRKAAEKIAELLRGTPGVELTIEEILDKKDRRGLRGWLGGGYDAMRKRPAAIEDVKVDVRAFDLVVIGTPVWAWTVTPAVRVFCEGHGRSAARVAFYCTMGGSGNERTFETMEQLCAKAPAATASFIDRNVKTGSPDHFVAVARAFGEQLLAAVSDSE